MLRISHKGAVCFYKLCVLEPETCFSDCLCSLACFSFLDFFFFLIMSLFKTLMDNSQGEFLLLSLHMLVGLK